MSVISTLEYWERPFTQAPPSTGLPSGIWVLQGSVVGDATGGVRQLNYTWSQPAGPTKRDNRYINLEQIHVQESSDDSSAALLINNFDPGGALGALDLQFRLFLANMVSSGFVGTGPELFGSNVYNFRPYFIGRPNSTPGQDSSFIIDMANADGEAVDAKLQGYFWLPEAINAAMGGPVRPPWSIFGS